MLASATLGEIAGRLGGELIGDRRAAHRRGRRRSKSATPSTIALPRQPALRSSSSRASRAGCVIVAPALREAALARGAAIVTPDPYLYFARLTQWWAERTRPRRRPACIPSAVVDPGAQVGADASIGAFAVIEAGASIGAGVASARTASSAAAAGSAPARGSRRG